MRVQEHARLLTITEVAASLRLSRPTVYRLIHERILPAHRVGAGLGSIERVVAEQLHNGKARTVPTPVPTSAAENPD